MLADGDRVAVDILAELVVRHAPDHQRRFRAFLFLRGKAPRGQGCGECDEHDARAGGATH
jgi:hypothetical protein